MATKTFEISRDSTISVEGNIFTLTIPVIPDGVHIYANDVEIKANQPFEITSNISVSIDVPSFVPPTLTVNYQNEQSAIYDSEAITDGQVIKVTEGAHTMTFVGATEIPQIQFSANGLTGFTVNSVSHNTSELPYTFTPTPGQMNIITASGEATEAPEIVINGTNIDTVNVNNQEVTLPYKVQTYDDLNIAVSGKQYSIDIDSTGGASISRNDTNLSDGTAPYHESFTLSDDMRISIDGTHVLNIDGDDIKQINVNGVVFNEGQLPATLRTNKMTADVDIIGYPPSEVHVTGVDIISASIDSKPIPINDGNVEYEFATREENHFITMTGKQAKEINVTFNDTGSTTIQVDGVEQENGTISTSKDIYVQANSKPIPVHIESQANATVEVNGRKYTENDFTVEIYAPTEIDVETSFCTLTIDYGDNSVTLDVPQSIIYLTAPHRDGWIFDGWSSDNIGIGNPKQVRTTLDLRNKRNANLVCHYQRCITWNKPNSWN